jgi:hypothetical protein
MGSMISLKMLKLLGFPLKNDHAIGMGCNNSYIHDFLLSSYEIFLMEIAIFRTLGAGTIIIQLPYMKS